MNEKFWSIKVKERVNKKIFSLIFFINEYYPTELVECCGGKGLRGVEKNEIVSGAVILINRVRQIFDDEGFLNQ